MSSLQPRLEELLPLLRRAATDTQFVEVKDASGGFPRSILETVSAFSNGAGGFIVLGLAEPAFVPTGIDADAIASTLADQCSDNLEPPIRPEIEICVVDGESVVVADVQALDDGVKPCSVKIKDQPPIAYIRSHDGDRRFTSYEHHAIQAAKEQPADDERPVRGTSLVDLDPQLVEGLLSRIRETRSAVFGDASDEHCLRLLGVLTDATELSETATDDGQVSSETAISLGGLLALGRYPQQHFPRLNISFVAYAAEGAASLPDGTRYLDSQLIEGSIPAMLEGAAAALRRNMRQRGVVVGLFREDYWEYPLEAVREIVINALLHRDYHPAACGQPVKLELYPDRLVITSPGGIFGAIDPGDLLVKPVTASRNSRLARLLHDVPMPGTSRTVCENIGTGLITAAQALKTTGMAPPSLEFSLTAFEVTLPGHAVLDDESTGWLSELGRRLPAAATLSDRQRLGLAYVWRHKTIDNPRYRVLTGCSPAEATSDLADLRERGLLERVGGRRWAQWHLASDVPRSSASAEAQRGSARDRPASSDSDVGARPPGSQRREASLPPRREVQVLEALAEGPLSTRELAERFGVSLNAVRNWLRALEQRQQVRPTEPGRRSRYQRWRLIDQR
ncbi:MAG: putative DNA binding domain-containing protein [Acidimicrobiaceae bacterium]|nr:putative DNA binding domain-containing protein [Acidimicrobiaceae bacterium]